MVCCQGGGCQQQEEVCCGFLKRDTHFLALAADQLQPARRLVVGSGVALEAETLTLPRGGTDAGRLGGIGAAMCWRCGVVSRNEVCVFFHREINNSPGMSGLPASGKGWFWQARAYLQPSCRGTGLARSQRVGAGDIPGCGSLLCRWPSHMGRGWEPSWPCLCSAPGQSLPSLWGAFPASPSMGLAKGVALSKPGHAGRASLLCLGAGGLGTGGQSRLRC